ncbi:hypothetical protein Tco_0352671 [Tanacetum coccineum]
MQAANACLQMQASISSCKCLLANASFNCKKQMQAAGCKYKQMGKQPANASYNWKLQLQDANASCKCKLQLQAANASFNCKMQMQASIARSKCKLQLQAANASFNYKLQIARWLLTMSVLSDAIAFDPYALALGDAIASEKEGLALVLLPPDFEH